ncbi:MAG: DEAD/DEAH box helicase [Nakamurella sp.]
MTVFAGVMGSSFPLLPAGAEETPITAARGAGATVGPRRDNRGMHHVPDDRDLLGVLLRAVPAWQEPVTHVEHLAARAGTTAPWPQWVPTELREALGRRGVREPWLHQVQAAEAGHDGRPTVIATGTASGKSLAFQLPVLSDLLTDDKACALYLSPTKALAADQLAALEDLRLPGIRPAAYDGDTPLDERDWVRDHARFVLTNPDMLHWGVLPMHQRWARLLRRLRYVVIDECHSYRGVFGSHVAQVIRRLRRVAALYRSKPVFILASATVADPAEAASRLTGFDAREVITVSADSAPRAARRFVLWEPPLVRDEDTASMGDAADQDGTPVRRSAPKEVSRMLADLVSMRVRTLAFVRSRRAAEQVALSARRRLERTDPEVADRVAAYRGGYLAEDRRLLEKALDSGDLLGVASTTALELGIDIAGLDATLIAASRAPWRRCGSRPGGQAAAARTPPRRWWCSSRGTIRWTRTWCTILRRCSGGRWRQPSPIRRIRTCSGRTCAARRLRRG